jgi:hypothetical protein
VVLDNSLGIFQLVGLKGRFLCLDEYCWIPKHNP